MKELLRTKNRDGLAACKDVAKYFSVSTETIKRWGKNPDVPLREIVINCRVVRYHWREIYALADQNVSDRMDNDD